MQAVIYDRDGVLTKFKLDEARTFFGQLLPIDVFGISQRWQAWGARVGFPRTAVEEHAFFAGFWNSIADEFALPTEHRHRLLRVNYVDFMAPYPDALESMRLARKHGLSVGVLSNFTLASLEMSLKQVGLFEHVDAALSSVHIGVAKPSPEAYFAITKALQVEPAACVMFDDEIENITGAREVGMRAFLVDRRRETHDIGAGVAADLSALAMILEERGSS